MNKFLLILTLLVTACVSNPFRQSALDTAKTAVQLVMDDRPFCSGVVIGKNRVLTNDHCTRLGAMEGFVVFLDGSKKPYKTVKQGDFDNSPDLSIIEVETDIAPPELGEMPHQGDWAISMGSPQTMGWTFTMGVISAVDRELKNSYTDHSEGHFIQHDVLINPGSSGSGLFNIQGQLIGLNSRGGSGMGYAVPITQIKEFLNALPN